VSSIIPATPDWRICLPNDKFGQRFFQIAILAWHIDSDCNVVPITAFGLADIAGGYVLATPDLFVAMPNGPVFNDYNEVAAHLAKGAA
jgi:hypothetical protein